MSEFKATGGMKADGVCAQTAGVSITQPITGKRVKNKAQKKSKLAQGA